MCAPHDAMIDDRELAGLSLCTIEPRDNYELLLNLIKTLLLLTDPPDSPTRLLRAGVVKNNSTKS